MRTIPRRPVCALLKQEKYKHFGITFCRATIYKYVEDGVFLTLTNQDLPEKGDRKKKHRTIRKKQARASSGTSIEQRPEYINERQERDIGKWIPSSGRNGRKPASSSSPSALRGGKSLSALRTARRDGRRGIRPPRAPLRCGVLSVFKTITVDNGSEFADADGIERSARRKDAKRTTVYYCHAYSSCERGTNENINRMIRRQFQKGTDFDKVTAAEVKRVETWLNNYPREILGFMSSAEAFKIAFDRAA